MSHISSGFTGSPHFRWGLWIKKKQIQVLFRTHLSHLLAAALAVLVVYRERAELSSALSMLTPLQWSVAVLLVTELALFLKYLWIRKMRRRVGLLRHVFYAAMFIAGGYLIWRFSSGLPQAISRIQTLQWLILILTLGTLIAAIWEFVGNKLATSHQEVRFIKGISQLLVELETFCFKSDPLDATSLDSFLTAFLGVARDVLCGEEDVGADLMLQTGELLRPVKRSGYPDDSEIVDIPLPNGAAGLAFSRMEPVYVPDKEWREAWLLSKVQYEEYQAQVPLIAWVDAHNVKKERFHSILCVPIAGYTAKKTRSKLGVLNFTTVVRDPFVNRDFSMAECFGSILSQALSVRSMAERERTQERQNQAGGKPISGQQS